MDLKSNVCFDLSFAYFCTPAILSYCTSWHVILPILLILLFFSFYIISAVLKVEDAVVHAMALHRRLNSAHESISGLFHS